ncbi:hypothetical protein LDENG_00222110 [Lucifuga dentata]|nr:hypothetical protein LDENG_00222110 [Lucifuga dentata]
MFEPNIFNFHTQNVTDSHFPKDTTGTVNFFFFPPFQTATGFSSFWYATKINLRCTQVFFFQSYIILVFRRNKKHSECMSPSRNIVPKEDLRLSKNLNNCDFIILRNY